MSSADGFGSSLNPFGKRIQVFTKSVRRTNSGLHQIRSPDGFRPSLNPFGGRIQVFTKSVRRTDSGLHQIRSPDRFRCSLKLFEGIRETGINVCGDFDVHPKCFRNGMLAKTPANTSSNRGEWRAGNTLRHKVTIANNGVLVTLVIKHKDGKADREN
jgi:hypothetical protein